MAFFDEALLTQAYLGWIYGITAMAFLHNFFVSIFLYKARQTNVSNILKIIFNFGGILRSIGQLWFLLVPIDVSIEECKGVSYMSSIANIIVRSSLAAFLLWRLRQVENKKSDLWIGITLFFIRLGINIGQVFKITPRVEFDAGEEAYFCVSGSDQIMSFPILFFDLTIDTFVTIRLVQILNRANRNASQISSNITRRTKRSLFTAVMYWNFVRLFLSICFNSVILYYVALGLNMNFDERLTVASNTLQNIFLVLVSYSLTADAEIVRVIEGRKDGSGSSNSAGTGKSFKNMPQTPKSTSTPSHYQTSSEPPKYSTGNYSYSGNEKTESNDIGDNKIAVVSMKRLSFFEWANVVVGNKRGKSNNDIADEESGVEIVEEIAEEVADNFNHSRNNNQNRDSSFSGTTTITTTTSSSTVDDDDIV